MREVPDPQSTAAAGLPAMYGELKAIAHRLRRRMQPGDTLSTTVVVHEAYTRLAGAGGVATADDRHLLSLCARAMRYVVIDHVRERAALKRGAGVANFALEVGDLPGVEDPAAVLELHQCLTRLEALDERLVRLIELRVFAGLEPPAIAEVLGITTRTVQRDWRRAHAMVEYGTAVNDGVDRATAFSRMNQLLEQALGLPRVERDAFLQQVASDAAELSRLQTLLTAAEGAPSLQDVACADAQMSQGWWPRTGISRVGEWRVLGSLGSGGMAEVLLAERDLAGSNQRAALKILHERWRDPLSLQRFAQERSILAQLDDARIARLLDGGVLEDGRPWLALEFVQGQHIDVWCDRRRLDLDARAQLVIQVAGAVASAHRQLVVHRDIKPANVLVSDAGQVKLLDFGIAKVLDAGPGPREPDTVLMALTPESASPEQLAGRRVTTASDIYQLGLLLYVLVCGRRPFQGLHASVPGLIRAVNERDAPSPLQAAGSDARAFAQISAQRATTPVRLRRQLRGELSVLLARALARDPDSRYASAGEFAADLQRWRDGKPLQARPPSPLYLLRCLIQRNPWASVMAGVLVLALAAFALSQGQQMQRAAEEAARNRSTRSFLEGLFLSADESAVEREATTAIEVLERGVAAERIRLAGQPQLLADLLIVLGDSLISRGRYAQAADELGEAVRQLESTPRSEPQTLAGALQRLGTAQHYGGRYIEAEQTLRRALAVQQAAPLPEFPWAARAHVALASVLHSRGDFVAADESAAAAWRLLPGRPPEELDLRVEIARLRGDIARDSGRLDRAEHWLRVAQGFQLRWRPDDRLGLAWTDGALAQTLALAGDGPPALPMAESALDSYFERRGAAHGGTAVTAYRSGIAAAVAGNPKLARARFEAAHAALAALGEPGHHYLAFARIELGWLDLADGAFDQAARAFASARAALEPADAAPHPRAGDAQLGQLLLLQRSGDAGAAAMLLAEVIALRRQAFGPGHAYVVLLEELQLGTPPRLPPQPPAVEALHETLRLRRALQALAAEPAAG